MTKKQAEILVREMCDDDPEIENLVEDMFLALYEREADAEDRSEGLWSLCCEAVEDLA